MIAAKPRDSTCRRCIWTSSLLTPNAIAALVH
jgi:hypothetical protein